MARQLTPGSDEWRTLDALARVIVPQAFGDGPAAVDVVGLVAARAAALPPHLRAGVLQALAALGNPLLRGFVSRRIAPWHTLPDAERAAAFARWGTSSLGLARTVHEAVRRLVLWSYYATDAGRRGIGVLPPLHQRTPIVAWEGPLESSGRAEGVVARGSRHQAVQRANPPRIPPDANISSGSAMRGSFRLKADAVVVGSGAGGSLVAARLAAAGREVVIVEAGPYLTGPDFTEDEATLYPRLFADAGLRATRDLSVGVLQGAAVGGSTTVNWMVMLRTPAHVLGEWQRDFGLAELTPQRMCALFDEIERDLRVGQVPDDAHSPANRALLDGAAKLGWRASATLINAHGCVRAGTCSLGCRYGAKQSALEVYLPRALAQGARLLAETHVDRLERRERDGGSGTPPLTRVHARTLDTQTRETVGEVSIDAPLVVLAAGAVETPALLQRSGLGGGGVGRYLRLHPTTAVMGEYDRDIYPLAGIPLSTMCDEFITSSPNEYGFWIECPALGPALAAIALPESGDAHRQRMLALARTAPFIALTRDGADVQVSNGSVEVDRRGNPRIRYRLGATDAVTVRSSVEAAAQLHLAAGATVARTLHAMPVAVRSERDLAGIRSARYGPHDLMLFSAHVNGTCRMGTDPANCGANPEGQRFGARGVYVADGSLLPTAPGVNPQETVMAMAGVVSEAILAGR